MNKFDELYESLITEGIATDIKKITNALTGTEKGYSGGKIYKFFVPENFDLMANYVALNYDSVIKHLEKLFKKQLEVEHPTAFAFRGEPKVIPNKDYDEVEALLGFFSYIDGGAGEKQMKEVYPEVITKMKKVSPYFSYRYNFFPKRKDTSEGAKGISKAVRNSGRLD